MKRTLLFAITLVFALSFSNNAQAQFWKKLGDKIAEKAEDRIINDAGKATDKTIGRAEKEAAKGIKGDGKKKQKNNKKNNKTLSQGGWPVAGVQSGTAAPLPDNYQLSLSGSGPDMYLEYQIRMEGTQTKGMAINVQMYSSPDRGSRTQMKIDMAMLGGMNMVMLTNAQDPQHIVMLNEKKKKFSILDLNKLEESDENDEQFTVTKLGNETLHGLACTRVKVTAGTSDETAFELWTSREIPGYQEIMKLYSKNKNMGSDNLYKALEEADCGGFMVKMVSKNQNITSIMELVKLEKTTVDPALLMVPAGYEKTEKMSGLQMF